MKNLIILVLLFISLKSFAQFPITQSIGADSTLLLSKGGTKSRFVNKPYTDTTQANLERIKFYDGAQIYTKSGGGRLWVRDSTQNKWIAAGGTLQQVFDLEGATAVFNKQNAINLNGRDFLFQGTRNITVLSTGNLQMGGAGRISSNGTDTIKFTQSASDVLGASVVANKYIFYANGTSQIPAIFLYAPQGDFLNIHSPGQINFETPIISQDQNVRWLMGAKAPLVFEGSGNTPTPDLIDIFNSDTSNLNNQGGISFSLNRTAFVKMKIARIVGMITDTAFHSPDGDLVFYTTKDSAIAEAFRIKGSKQLQATGYGAGTITGTPTKNLAVDASGNVIEVAVSGGGTLTAANNGLSLSGTTAQAGGSALIQYTSIALNGYPFTFTHNGVNNAAQSDSNSLRLSNNTLSTSTTDSLITPSLLFSTNSRKTFAGAASQPIAFRFDAYGTFGSTLASGIFRLSSKQNTQAYATIFSISSTGIIQQNLNVRGLTVGIGVTSDVSNTVVGTTALASASLSGTNNVAIGSSPLRDNTSGNWNVGIGTSALLVNTTGSYNTAIGKSALSSVNTDFNTAVGVNSLAGATSGEQNTAIGYNALVIATTGIKNTSVGAGSMEGTTTGGFNSGLGHDVMLQNTTGSDNTAIGYLAGSQNRTGNGSVSSGENSGRGLVNANYVVSIGLNSNYLKWSGAAIPKDTIRNSIAIGTHAYNTTSNQIMLGSDSISTFYAYGIASGSGPKFVIYDPTTKQLTYIDTSFHGGGGGGGTLDHAALTNLSWVLSGHTGTLSTLAGFNSSNVAAVYTLSGTGTVVALTTSPTFTTPALGTPTAGVLTNTTGYLWNNLTDPTADQALTFGAGFSSTWTNSNTTEDLLTINTSTLTTASLFSLNSTSTALAAGNNLAEFIMSGANGTVAITSTAIRAQVTNTNGTSGTNKAAQFNASGATTANWALYTGTATGADGRINVNNATDVANQVMVIKSLTNTAADGIIIKSNDESTSSLNIGSQTITASAAMILASSSAGVQIASRLYVGTSGTSPTAIVHIKAGTTAASSAPLKLTSGTSMTAAEAGAVEFTTDDLFFTITTGTARKRLLMADPVGGLTAGRVPFPATANRLTDDASFTYGVTSGLGVSTTSTGTILSIGGAITPSAGSPGWITQLGGSITEASSGTHSILAGVAILAPTVTPGAAAVTNAASLYISGTPNASGATTSAIWAVGTLRLGQNAVVGGGINIEGLTSGTVSFVVPAIAGTTTLTTPIVTGTLVQYSQASIASSAAPAPTGDARENYLDITALAADPTFAAPSGTAVNHNALTIRLKDNGTPRTLSWNGIFRGGVNIALPSISSANLTMYIQFIYNSTDTKWDIVGLSDGY